MLLTVNVTSGAAWCCRWLCSLVHEKVRYRKNFIRNKRVQKISSEPDAIIKRATSDSRPYLVLAICELLTWLTNMDSRMTTLFCSADTYSMFVLWKVQRNVSQITWS